MVLPYLLGRHSSSILKANLKNNILKASCPVFNFRQPNIKLINNVNVVRTSSSLYFRKRESPPLIKTEKTFSTNPPLFSHNKNHDHSKIWSFERLLSVALLPLTPAALLYPSQSLDMALALIIVLHTHYGLEAIVVDYVRPILFGEVLPKVALGLLYIVSIITLAGLIKLIYNDAGLANTIINIWKKIKKKGRTACCRQRQSMWAKFLLN